MRDVGGNMHGGAGAVGFGPHRCAPLRHVGGASLHQIGMAIEAGAFVEPSLAERGIDADGQDIGATVIIEEIGEIDAEGSVAARILADDAAVHEDEAVAEDAVELQPDPAVPIGRADGKGAAIPADAVFRIFAPDRLEAVRGDAIFDVAVGRRGKRPFRMREGQAHRPVVRYADLRPVAVVEAGHCRGRGILLHLGEAALVAAETEIALQIDGVAEMKAPAIREAHPLARRRSISGGCLREPAHWHRQADASCANGP